jgi:putative phosphotransacetylase
MLFDAKQIAEIVGAVYSRVQYLADPKRVVIGISNRHVHLSQEDLKFLFGIDDFDIFRQVRQPGEYAATQQVTVIGAKGSFDRVRVMGPCRAKTQVELSATDCRTIGVEAPVTQSGHLETAGWVEIESPYGRIRRQGAMIAARHIHMGFAHAQALGVKDQETVQVRFDGVRGGVLDNFIIRTKENWVPEIHLDTDEANALGVKSGEYGTVV